MSRFSPFSSTWQREVNREEEIFFDPDQNKLTDPMWPSRRSTFCGDGTVPFMAVRSPRTDRMFYVTSGVGWKLISGIAKDSTGAVLAGATVKAYRTADDVYINSAVSEADGAYSVAVDTTGNHYVVAYKAGTPDIAGTTVNTLVGS